jgi:hypothetical protein
LVVRDTGLIQILMPCGKRRTECAPRIASGGLYPDTTKRALAIEATVSHAVERNTAGEAQVIYLELSVNRLSKL